jgi:hypothetical protein
MTKLTEPIFDLDSVLEFSYNRVKDDFVKVFPNSGSDLTKAGTIRLEINNQQNFISLSDSFLACEFSLTKADGTALGNDDITLENNFFPRMFSGMTLQIGGRDVEQIVQAPGEASTLANFVMCSDSYRKTTGMLSGWCPDTNKGDTDVDNTANDANQGYYWRKKIYNDKKTFVINFPLKYLFGFTEYTKILYLIKISLLLQLDDPTTYSPKIFYGAATTTGKLTMNNLCWWIPSIQPSLEIEEIITKRLNTKKPIDVVFMKRNMENISIPAGTIYQWKLGNYANSVRFVIVGFKDTTVTIDAQHNNSLFTANKITSLRLQLNNLYYPIDRMQFDFQNYKISEPYQSYINICQTFGNEPQLTLQEFHDLSPIFCIDCSSQPETLKNNGVDLTLHIEKSSALTVNAYALVIEDVQYTIDVMDGKMLRVN